MRPDQRISKKFIVGLHRYGNSLEGLHHAHKLKKHIGSTAEVYVELDLKWFCQNGQWFFYCYHGLQIPGLRLDLLKTRKQLLHHKKKGGLVLFEDILRNCKTIGLLIHIKNGRGNTTKAFAALDQLLKKYKIQKRLLFSNSFIMNTILKRCFSNEPIGSVHEVLTRNHLIHHPDYDIRKNIFKHGFVLKQKEFPFDFALTQCMSFKRKKLKQPVIMMHVNSPRRFARALSLGALGVSIYAKPEELTKIVRPLGL